VIDDGDTITELEHPVTVIPAAEWPTYSSERFPRNVVGVGQAVYVGRDSVIHE
jgi:hypothetical protein